MKQAKFYYLADYKIIDIIIGVDDPYFNEARTILYKSSFPGKTINYTRVASRASKMSKP